MNRYSLVYSPVELEELTALSNLIDDDAAIRNFHDFLGSRMNILVSAVQESMKGDTAAFVSSVGALRDKLAFWEKEISRNRYTVQSLKGHVWCRLAD